MQVISLVNQRLDESTLSSILEAQTEDRIQTMRPVGRFIDLDNEIIDDVLVLNNRAIADKNLRVEKDSAYTLFVQGFPAQLRQVFSNLIRNAIEASFMGGRIRIEITPSRLGINFAEPALRVTIADYGMGIPPENIKRIFEAFFTTKDLKGSGVGLWLSSTIVHEHGGHLQVRSKTRLPQPGTCMSVVLPCRSVCIG